MVKNSIWAKLVGELKMKMGQARFMGQMEFVRAYITFLM